MKFDAILYVIKPNVDEATSIVLLEIKRYAEKNNIICYSAGSVFLSNTRYLIIAIGGDGTMLGAMRLSLEIPQSYVFGINTGSLGFLSEEISSVEEALDNIANNGGVFEERMALTGELFIDDKSVAKNITAINEFTMVGVTLQRPVTINIDINNRLINEIVGSGVLVATATGSTAMALSSGGAIISPSTNVMQIVPILSHTLTSRPIITTGRDTITLSANIYNSGPTIDIYGDGTFIHDSNDGSEKISLEIKKHEKVVVVVRPSGWNFFNVLSEKMKW